jgi:hypothetical protein
MKTKLIIIAAILSLSGCNLTVDPDGTRNWSLNREAARAIIIYSVK